MDDILIIGGGVIGSSIAYHLAADGRGGRITVVERDPTYEFATSPRSLGGIRQQFSLPENILLSQYSLDFYQDFDEFMAVDDVPASIGLRQQGYLFLLRPEDRALFEANQEIQRSLHAPVEMLELDAVAARYPSLCLDGLDGAAFGPADGWFDPHGAVQGFRRKARSLGVTYVDDEVVGIDDDGEKVTGVRLESGDNRAAGVVINAAGAAAGEVAAMAGMALPVVPLRRQVFFFEIRKELEPLAQTIDPSGVYFRPEGKGYLAGRSDPDEPPGFNFTVDQSYFDDVIWPVLAARVPAFEALKGGQSWACHYENNQFDENLIIGPWVGGLDGFYVACGLSGHGIQQAPAVGLAMAELLLDGGYETLDLSRFGYRRVIDDEPLFEAGIV
ncbi:MAG: FAD-binding oxidoreductase [Alphaproteobacteria bacterium]